MGNPVCIHLWYHCCVFCTALMRPDRAETVLSAVVHSLVPHDSNVTVCNSKSRGLPVYSVHVRTILLSKCLPCPYVLSVSSVYIYIYHFLRQPNSSTFTLIHVVPVLHEYKCPWILRTSMGQPRPSTYSSCSVCVHVHLVLSISYKQDSQTIGCPRKFRISQCI